MEKFYLDPTKNSDLVNRQPCDESHLSLLPALSNINEEVSTCPITNLPFVYSSRADEMNQMRLKVRDVTIRVADRCVDAGLLYRGNRIVGMNDDNVIIKAQLYKGRTMPELSDAQQAEKAAMRRRGELVKDTERTELGEILERKNIDEIASFLINALTGEVPVFGETRPFGDGETESDPFLQACIDVGQTREEVLKKMKVGFFCTMHFLGARKMTPIGIRKAVYSIVMPDEIRPSNLKKVYGVALVRNHNALHQENSLDNSRESRRTLTGYFMNKLVTKLVRRAQSD